MLKNSKKTALIVFAREPKLGKVKTRLQKSLPAPYKTIASTGPAAVVLQLYKAFIKDVLNIAQAVGCDQKFIYYAGSGHAIPFLRQFGKQFLLKHQAGKDLGERMHRAFMYCRKQGFDKMVVIGTDCLTIKPRDIDRAFQKLTQHDCVLGPAKDGGYYLIGLKEPEWAMFDHIPWSTAEVLTKTLKKAKQLRYKTYLLPRKEDIDTLRNLQTCRNEIEKLKYLHNTIEVLRSCKISEN